ncbi:outer membrane protein assembly factor BamA [Alloacidobacterium dinghuense]|uniref:outer membrane protein assembly factor BamA n=1 Tax=Alloacidobacterium dinghuense TaxID=2763107 RepID=UPI002036C405|nr:outer membrane protein assembly factor BamA [Alloacidobacterium dinghuense]
MSSPIKTSQNASRKFRRTLKPLAFVLLCFTVFSAWAQQQTITQIRVIGNRRIPKETILARMFSHENEAFDPTTVERDFNSLWNTGYFEDVRIEREENPKGGIILDVYVREKATIREINYKGLNSVTQSDVLDRLKKEKVGFSVESQYDPTRIARVETVIKELLSEHGRQFATIKADVKTIPPASVQVNFIVKEGPKVKVGNISFTGNQHLSSRELRLAMKNLRPIGIPHSIIFENLFAKTYDASKLEEDGERVRQAYRDKGYFRASTGEPLKHLRNESGLSFFTFRPRKGKRIDIRIPVDEGARYRLGTITFKGNKAVPDANLKALRAQFPIKDGEWFNFTAFGKGLQNLQKAYGQLGYINFSASPEPVIDDDHKTVSFVVDLEEGKPFYVSRIEFQGNTVTRDFVIRRELLLEEGQVYNSHLWELSLLRLNQLDYFNPLKVDQDSETHQNPEAGTVDLLLKVTEKGKNSIGLNGGVSGLSGTFLGLNYQTNNFLGLGETLSVQASAGNLSRNLLFGFNEPYLRNKPVSLGFQLYSSKYDYNSAKAYNLSGADANTTAAVNSLTQNYNQSVTGFTVSGAYPIRHTFKRIGVTYSLNRSSVTTFSAASQNLFQTLAFRSGIQNGNSLEGIVNSMISLSYSWNKLDSSYMPRTGSSFSSAFQLAGLWGNVRYFQPVIEYKQFRPVKWFHFNNEGRNIVGYRVQANYIHGISGDVAPPFNRFYAGGEADLRGFDIRTATPYGFVPTRVLFNLTNPDGTCVPRDPTNPQTNQCVQVPIPVYGIGPIGGDTQITGNVEYRIPLVGRTAALEFFDDFGMNMATSSGQLKQSPQGFDTLNAPLYGCPNYVNGACVGGQTIQFDRYIRPIPGTNYVPRMSLGAQISVMMPIINAPFRIYYAYNPLRLYDNINGQNLITRSMFPAGGAGDYSYAQATQLYGSLYELREPNKTFRLTVSTTF